MAGTFKVRKAMERATSLVLVCIGYETDCPADVLVVTSMFIDSPVMRRLQASGYPVVFSKVAQQARPWTAVAALSAGVSAEGGRTQRLQAASAD